MHEDLKNVGFANHESLQENAQKVGLSVVEILALIAKFAQYGPAAAQIIEELLALLAAKKTP